MAAARISTWKERLLACFQWQKRLLHVFGIPSAVGAVTAVAAASALNPDAGLAIGALTAGTGVLLAGYYVVAGFDRKLAALHEAEDGEQALAHEQDELSRLLVTSEPEMRAQLERCLSLYAAIDVQFSDGIDDAVEAVLQNSRGDLATFKARAIDMVKLYHRLSAVVRESNANALMAEVRRMDQNLSRLTEGSVRDALLAARESSVRMLEQWQDAFAKRQQVASVLTLIENNLQEFKLAMELRKADATLGTAASGPDVSDLQARLTAAGQACDELVGRSARGRSSRERRVS